MVSTEQSQIIRRSDLLNEAVADMRVEFRCFTAFVSQQLLDDPQISSRFEQVGRIAVPKPVEGSPTLNICPRTGGLKDFLQPTFVVSCPRVGFLEEPTFQSVGRVVFTPENQDFFR